MGSTFIDISGQTFNELTAISCIDTKNRIWLWRCSCGKECTARKNDVTSGRKKSCGHLSNRGNATINIDDKFNEWTVIKDLGNRHFLCRCSCGTEKSVHSYDLRKGNSKSCGHLTRGTSENGKIDLKDQVFGEWTVLRYDNTPKKYGYWICRCSCGTEKSIRGIILRKGQSTSCGHATNAFQDLKDQVFGEWTALRYLGDYLWECRCSCGNIKSIKSYDLIHGKSTNCGCKRTPQLIDKRFGKLTVKKYLGNNTWECLCECKNITIALTNNLINGNKLSCGCLTEDKKQEIRDNIKYAIQTFIDSNGQLPFIVDIAEATGLTKTTVHKYVNELGLSNYINISFGSRPERDIYNFVCQFTDKVILHDKKVLNGKELDIYIPSHKLAIEFNGTYWHSFEKLGDKKYHQNKTIACAKQGIQLIHIFEYEWNDLVKQEKIKNYIKRLLVKDSQNKIYARNTEIKQITSSIADDFCNKYHLQGKATASVNYGCYLGEELIGIMTFGAPRFNNNYDYELVRLCWKDSVVVTGGTEKLLSQFIKDYNPNSIITYTDISKFNGNVYTKLGFKPIQPNSITEPNYVWISQETDLLLPRYKTQKHQLIEQGLGTEEQTEIEIMHNHSFIQIYDCGNIRLEWIRK